MQTATRCVRDKAVHDHQVDEFKEQTVVVLDEFVLELKAVSLQGWFNTIYNDIQL